jgi:DNA-binding NarL/FixJ family response regulator
MAAPGQDDSLADLRRYLLEREARLGSLLEQLLHGDQPEAPPETTARPAPTTARDGPMRLTGREVQILHLLIRGQTNRQIAAQLRLVPGTVRNRLGRIYQKLGVTTRTHAAVRAVELGLSSHGSGYEAAASP